MLRWMLTGWERVRARLERGEPGLVTPQKITDDTAAYREKESAVSRFFEEHLEARQEWKVPAAKVYAAYVNWCKQTNEYQESATELTLSIQRYCDDNGIPLETGIRETGMRKFKGLAFKDSVF